MLSVVRAKGAGAKLSECPTVAEDVDSGEVVVVVVVCKADAAAAVVVVAAVDEGRLKLG